MWLVIYNDTNKETRIQTFPRLGGTVSPAKIMKKNGIWTGLGKAVKWPEILDIEFCTLEVLGMMCLLLFFLLF